MQPRLCHVLVNRLPHANPVASLGLIFHEMEIMAATQSTVARHKANTVCEDALKTGKEQLNVTLGLRAAQLGRGLPSAGD